MIHVGHVRPVHRNLHSSRARGTRGIQRIAFQMRDSLLVGQHGLGGAGCIAADKHEGARVCLAGTPPQHHDATTMQLGGRHARWVELGSFACRACPGPATWRAPRRRSCGRNGHIGCGSDRPCGQRAHEWRAAAPCSASPRHSDHLQRVMPGRSQAGRAPCLSTRAGKARHRPRAVLAKTIGVDRRHETFGRLSRQLTSASASLMRIIGLWIGRGLSQWVDTLLHALHRSAPPPRLLAWGGGMTEACERGSLDLQSWVAEIGTGVGSRPLQTQKLAAQLKVLLGGGRALVSGQWSWPWPWSW